MLLKDTQRGLSLVETILATSITVLVFGLVTGGIAFFYRTNAYGIEQSFAVSSARSGVEDMVESIREATYSDGGAFPIESIGSDTLVIYSDVDADTSVEKVSYAMNGTSLEKTIVEPVGYPPDYDSGTPSTEIVANDIRNDSQGVNMFNYFDSSGIEITNYSQVADVVFIRVNLVVNVNPNRLPNEFTLQGSARLRNVSN